MSCSTSSSCARRQAAIPCCKSTSSLSICVTLAAAPYFSSSSSTLVSCTLLCLSWVPWLLCQSQQDFLQWRLRHNQNHTCLRVSSLWTVQLCGPKRGCRVTEYFNAGLPYSTGYTYGSHAVLRGRWVHVNHLQRRLTACCHLACQSSHIAYMPEGAPECTHQLGMHCSWWSSRVHISCNIAAVGC